MTNGVSAKLETATHWQCSQISSDYLLLLPRFRPRTVVAKRARDREIPDETNDFSLEPHGIFERNSARSAVYIDEIIPLCNRGRNGISLQEDIVFAFVDANCECLNFGTNSRWNYYCRFMARLEVAFLVKATTAIISNLDLFTLSYTDLYHVKWYLMETLLAIEAN